MGEETGETGLPMMKPYLAISPPFDLRFSGCTAPVAMEYRCGMRRGIETAPSSTINCRQRLFTVTE
jgi:hypothetical protein